MKHLVLILCICCIATNVLAQNTLAPSPILIIYDASGSMWGQLDGKTKKDIAANVLSETINNLSEDQKIGLIAYGHRKKGDCQDIEFLASLNNGDKDQIISTVKGLNAVGKTPLARSAQIAISSIKESNTKATLILITDGIESCDGTICDVVSKAKQEGIDFKLHIIGFGLKEGEAEQLRCAADAGDGNYYDAANAIGLSQGLTEATTKTVDKPEGNFSVYAVKNGKPVDAWVKARRSGAKRSFDGARTYRDSAWVYLTPGKYEIEVAPLEGSDIPSTSITVEMKEGDIKHETISFDGGTLDVTTTNNDDGWDAVVKMIDTKTGKPVATVRTYGKTKSMEVPAGSYKVTFQALALKGDQTYFEAENVVIKSNEKTQISHDYHSGIAKIGVKTASGELIDATVNFIDVASNKRVTGGRTYTSEKNNPREFLLTPGKYTVKIVTLGVHKGNSKTLTIEVKKGEITTNIITF